MGISKVLVRMCLFLSVLFTLRPIIKFKCFQQQFNVFLGIFQLSFNTIFLLDLNRSVLFLCLLSDFLSRAEQNEFRVRSDKCTANFRKQRPFPGLDYKTTLSQISQSSNHEGSLIFGKFKHAVCLCVVRISYRKKDNSYKSNLL